MNQIKFVTKFKKTSQIHIVPHFFLCMKIHRIVVQEKMEVCDTSIQFIETKRRENYLIN